MTDDDDGGDATGAGTTPRGFAIYADLTDSYGHQVVVQQSSSADFDACWVFCYPGSGDVHGSPSPHLSVPQARAVRDALSAFISQHEMGDKLVAVHITAPGSVVVVEVPAAWSASEAQREQTRIIRNVAKTEAPTHVIVVRGSGDASAAESNESNDEAEGLEELEAVAAG